MEWYHRLGLDRWQMRACELHGTELVALGFQRGVSLGHVAQSAGVADACALCVGSTSIAEVRACRCHERGDPCSVHVGSRLVDVAIRRTASEFTWALAGTLLGLPCRPLDKFRELSALSQDSLDARAVKVPLPPSGAVEPSDVAPPVPLHVLGRLVMGRIDDLFTLFTSPSERTAGSASATPANRSRRSRRRRRR
jgi:Fe2+ transport system protein FeoA